ncbi:hypothetical protein GCM10010833_33410 [Blastomonas aquatica]|uniref:Exosortase n=1 Tax=Blastomonas aquatica TaxID=1510276 RepID=A0ABQ1JR44_9SPHN|nr:hypothetical protein GCM10010833_33410 [Blastomonas aquatica]
MVLLLPAAAALARQTWRSEAGSLSPLILLFGLWTVWRMARDSRVQSRSGTPAVWAAILALSLPLYLVAIMIDSITVIALMAWVISVTVLYAMAGWAMVRACRIPLIFLALVVPLPYALSAYLNALLRGWLSQWSVEISRWIGIDAALEEGNIVVNQYLLSVEAACAGVNSTISLVAIGFLFAFWVYRSHLKGIVLISALAIPIALVANLLRVLCLIALVDLSGPAPLGGLIHPLSGILSFIIALAMLVGVARGIELVVLQRANPACRPAVN